MERVHIETTVQDGRIVIDDLPFDDGKKVDVFVTDSKNANGDEVDPYSLRGTPYRYDDPFAPLIEPEDWKPFA